MLSLVIVLLRAAALLPLRATLETHPPGTHVDLDAWVHGRRVLSSQITFLTLGDGETSHDVQALLKRFDKQLVQLAAPGSRVAISGVVKTHERGWPVVECTDINVVRCAPLRAAVRKVLCAADDMRVSRDAACAALLLPPGELPASGDDEAVEAITASLQEAAPKGARAAADGRRPPRSEAASEHGIASLLTPDGLERATAAIDALGGADTAASLAQVPAQLDAGSTGSASMAVVEGEVRGRRRLSNGFATIDLWDVRTDGDSSDDSSLTIRCVVHDSFASNILPHVTLASAGARLRLAGVWSDSAGISDGADSDEDAPRVLLVCGARLLRSSHVLKAVRGLIDSVASDKLDALEAMHALDLPIPPDAADAADAAEALRSALKSEGSSERAWRANTLHRSLAAARATRLAAAANALDASAEQTPSPNRRPPSPRERQREAQQGVLTSLMGLRGCFPLVAGIVPDEQGMGPQEEASATGSMEAPNVPGLLPEAGASPPSRRVFERRQSGALSTGRDGSFWREKKRPQLLLMASIVEELLGDRAVGDASATSVDAPPVQIVDIGGSKGFLAQHLAERFGPRVNVSVRQTAHPPPLLSSLTMDSQPDSHDGRFVVVPQVVDIDPKRISSGAARARKRGVMPNLHFIAGDASDLSRRGVLSGVDVVLGLHACGGLSDLIIAHAVAHSAAFAVCTCCFLSNRALDVPAPSAARDGATLPRNSWLAAAPDGAIYGAIASDEEQLRLVLHAAELQDDPHTAELGAHSINAMRAAAAQQHWADLNPPVEGRGRPPELRVELRAFDSKFSARNFVVVGRPARGL